MNFRKKATRVRYNIQLQQNGNKQSLWFSNRINTHSCGSSICVKLSPLFHSMRPKCWIKIKMRMHKFFHFSNTMLLLFVPFFILHRFVFHFARKKKTTRWIKDALWPYWLCGPVFVCYSTLFVCVARLSARPGWCEEIEPRSSFILKTNNSDLERCCRRWNPQEKRERAYLQ